MVWIYVVADLIAIVVHFCQWAPPFPNPADHHVKIDIYLQNYTNLTHTNILQIFMQF